MRSNQIFIFLTMLSAIFFSACNQQLNKANHFISTANQKIQSLETSIKSTSQKQNELKSILMEEHPSSHTLELKTLSQDIINQYQGIITTAHEVFENFHAASTFDVKQTQKEYWALKSQIFIRKQKQLTAEQNKIKTLLKALEKDDFSNSKQQIDLENATIAILEKEIQELNNKAEEIVTKNPSDFAEK